MAKHVLQHLTRAAKKYWFNQDDEVAALDQGPISISGEYLLSTNAANSGTVNLIKANASDVPQLGDSAVIGTVATGTGAIVSIDGTQTLSNKTLANSTALSIKDANFTLQDDGDTTKRAQFQISGVTAGQTRVLTVPDYNATLATLAGSEALTNKTIGNTNTVTVKDANFTMQDDGDVTKQAQFQLSGVTAGQTRTLTVPDYNGTLATLAGSEALTNKTIGDTNTITVKDANFTLQDDGDVTKQAQFQLSGVTAGQTRTLTVPDYNATIATLAGTESLTNKTITGAVITDTVKASAQFDAVTGTTGTTLTNVTGMVVTVVPGSYKFRVCLPGVSTANCGIKAAFKLTTTVLTSIDATGSLFTASAVAVQHTTTTTDQTVLAAETAAVIYTVIEGVMLVGTGGTIQLQAAQNTAHADTTSVYVGANMTFTRFA